VGLCVLLLRIGGDAKERDVDDVAGAAARGTLRLTLVWAKSLNKCASCKVAAGAGAVDGFLREKGPRVDGSEGDRFEEDGFAALHDGDGDLGEFDVVDDDFPQVIGESGVGGVGGFEERGGQAHADGAVLDLFGGDGGAGDGGNGHFVLPRGKISAGIEA